MAWSTLFFCDSPVHLHGKLPKMAFGNGNSLVIMSNKYFPQHQWWFTSPSSELLKQKTDFSLLLHSKHNIRSYRGGTGVLDSISMHSANIGHYLWIQFLPFPIISVVLNSQLIVMQYFHSHFHPLSLWSHICIILISLACVKQLLCSHTSEIHIWNENYN